MAVGFVRDVALGTVTESHAPSAAVQVKPDRDACTQAHGCDVGAVAVRLSGPTFAHHHSQARCCVSDRGCSVAPAASH